MKAIGYEGYQGPRLTRQEQLARMHRVIENELTEKQRRAVLGYYVDKKTMPELAREFGVCKSTVCRTIQRAEKRLRGNITSARRADENALIRECQMHSTNFSAGTSPASAD